MYKEIPIIIKHLSLFITMEYEYQDQVNKVGNWEYQKAIGN